MRRLCALISIYVAISLNSVSYSQGLTTGFFSGINISDIHGNSYYGKWKFKPGPVQGAFINYNINRVLGFSTGINYSTLYYEHKLYLTDEPSYYLLSSSSYFPGFFYPSGESMDFSFITLPVQVKITIPSSPDLNLSAGIYYSFVQDENTNSFYPGYNRMRRDRGYLFSAGTAYPFNKDFDGLFNIRYITGRRDFVESEIFRHGSIDFTIGVAFKGFLHDRDRSEIRNKNDSSYSKIHLIYMGGTSLSWNSSGSFSDKYSVSLGPSAGFRLVIPLGAKASILTGLSFERTGYSFKDSSDIFYRFYVADDAQYLVDTRTTVDYIEIPALLNLSIGRANTFYINTGPYLAIKLNARCTGEAISEEKISSEYKLVKTVVYDDLEGLIKDNDAGWAIGTGVSIPVFEKYDIEFELQYKYGFTDIFDNTDNRSKYIYEKKEPVIRNSSVLFHIGFKVPVLK